MLWRFQSCSLLSIVSRTERTARLGSARLGPVGCSSTRRSCRLRSSAAPAALVSAQGRGTAAELGLRSVSSRSADIPLGERVGSVSVPCRRAAAASHLPFHGRRAEAAGRKEGRKKTRRACWELEFMSHRRAGVTAALKTSLPGMHLCGEGSSWHFEFMGPEH